jgi:hypothetical protein
MSVNLLVRQLETADFIDVVRNALADTDLSASGNMSYSPLQQMYQAIDRRRKGWRTTSNMKPRRNLLARAGKDPKAPALPDVTD